MEWQLPVEITIAVVVACLLAPIAWLFVRRRWLSGRGGVFDCSYRPGDGSRGWALGVAKYEGNALQWHRALGVGLRPSVVLDRGVTTFASQREATASEALELYASDVVVRLTSGPASTQIHHELAMAPASLTGLLSWLEAAPPGGQRYPGVE